ncbi:nuclear export factor GLE1 [Patulibacter medicamentivorans]|uniref:Nuclear export factor GLE1 n=1 Tax=Patulibacter medicamentivorans TaxID=1097667 RepID=H0E2I3_9ACTN|nr:DUF1775 domain-containing protein [Patulibacter medicamentivorans]EHN12093.1 nuclear export factor GLE1 [Patulibacter medicamentivorans]
MSKITVALATGTALAALALPAVAGAHATVSPLQPQGAALTAARGTYVLRAPNETDGQRTYKVSLLVPTAIRTSISIRQLPDWKVSLKTRKTGQKDAEGGDVVAISRITWTARTTRDEIAPHFYGEWPIRFQNPATPQALTFRIDQYYTSRKGSRKRPEVVRWAGGPGSDHPASVIDVVASAPAT